MIWSRSKFRRKGYGAGVRGMAPPLCPLPNAPIGYVGDGGAVVIEHGRCVMKECRGIFYVGDVKSTCHSVSPCSAKLYGPLTLDFGEMLFLLDRWM